MLKFSIVIPAYNEERLLAECLRSLAELDYPRNKFEIILVNNNSTDRTREIAQSFIGVKTVDEPKQGYVHALSKGCREAKGEILVFTDADTMVQPDWLQQYEQAYLDSEVVCACGSARFRPMLLSSLLAELAILLTGFFTKTSIETEN